MSEYIPRRLEADLVRPASRAKIRLLFGARQTGKSTLMRHLAAGEEAVHVDLQDSTQRGELERRPRAFSERLLALPGKKPVAVCVDEIQKVPALLEEIQHLYDSHPGRFRFLLTGSSARKLHSSSANLLPGRSHLFHLYPLTQGERGKGGEILPPGSAADGPHFSEKNLARLLLFGSLPGVQFEAPETAAKTLHGYVELYLEEEIRREGLVRDLGAFGRFLELAALESGKTMNLTKLSNECGVALSSLRLYYQVLVDTFAGYWLEPYKSGGRKRLLATPRFYLFDLGVRNAAARLPMNDGLLKLQGGEILEHWVGLELIHRARMLGPGHRVGFYRTVGGAEVDFIVETPEGVIPVEVKWTESPVPGDASHVESFLEDHPEKARTGYVVCRVPQRRRLTDRVLALPWNEL